MQLPAETSPLLLTRSASPRWWSDAASASRTALMVTPACRPSVSSERQLTSVRAAVPGLRDHLDGTDLGVARDQRSLGALSAAGRAVLGAVPEGSDAHPGHPERRRDGAGDGGEDLLGRRCPVRTRGQAGQSGVRVRPVAVHHAVDQPLQPRPQRQHGQGCGGRDDAGSEGRELGAHRREQADHRGVPGRDEDAPGPHRRTSATPRRRLPRADAGGPRRPGRRPGMPLQQRRGCRPPAPRPPAPRRRRSRRHPARGAATSPGCAPPRRHATRRTTTAARTRRSGTCSSHSTAERVSAQAAGRTPTGLDGESNRGGPVGVGRGRRPSTNTQASTSRTWAPRSGTPPAAATAERESTVGQEQEREHGAGTSTAAKRSTYQIGPAVARAREARPHLGQRGSGEDRGHGQDEPTDGLRGRAAASIAPGTPHSAGSRAAFQLISPPASRPDHKRSEPGRRGHPGHCPGKEPRPPRGPPAQAPWRQYAPSPSRVMRQTQERDSQPGPAHEQQQVRLEETPRRQQEVPDQERDHQHAGHLRKRARAPGSDHEQQDSEERAEEVRQQRCHHHTRVGHQPVIEPHRVVDGQDVRRRPCPRRSPWPARCGIPTCPTAATARPPASPAAQSSGSPARPRAGRVA